jgi:hypothetical protein
MGEVLTGRGKATAKISSSEFPVVVGLVVGGKDIAMAAVAPPLGPAPPSLRLLVAFLVSSAAYFRHDPIGIVCPCCSRCCFSRSQCRDDWFGLPLVVDFDRTRHPRRRYRDSVWNHS